MKYIRDKLYVSWLEWRMQRLRNYIPANWFRAAVWLNSPVTINESTPDSQSESRIFCGQGINEQVCYFAAHAENLLPTYRWNLKMKHTGTQWRYGDEVFFIDYFYSLQLVFTFTGTHNLSLSHTRRHHKHASTWRRWLKLCVLEHQTCSPQCWV